jgi:NRPS condensation-like uncharacterized protein
MSLARESIRTVTFSPKTVLVHLSQAGLRCAITNAVRATNVGVIKGGDHLFTGKVEKVDVAITSLKPCSHKKYFTVSNADCLRS